MQALNALNLHALRKLLKSDAVWCFLIAVDTAANRWVSYLDIRVRLVSIEVLTKYHVLAILFSDSHTGENMCQLVVFVLRVLAGDEWSKKLLAVTSDGASNMVGRHRGLQTLLECRCEYPIFRVWCGAQQMDLIVETCVAKQLHNYFYQPLTALSLTYGVNRDSRQKLEHSYPQWLQPADCRTVALSAAY